ncbi:thiol reductant ABC exporter subunit CydD [Aquisalimonas lutea]|uniref:thiol reductant ABC exporter subunit CydD n=1 Tax=Aquisalimonas lutea TaxID=1327750 RepID=UPI0025B56134|nr:thiol reductant ABC exporter subunit CydD [Aquisalimonas lutea]MDN3518259.1 thiol reductant ABC exporter subunit CydD [Aquisalimonas lutea]
MEEASGVGAGAGDTGNEADRSWLRARARAAGSWTRVVTVAGLLAGWLVIAQAALLASLVQRVAADGAGLRELGGLLAGLLVVLLLRAGCTAVQEWAAAETAHRVHRAARERLYQHLLALGPAGIARHAPGGLASAVVEQVAALGPYVARYQPQMVITVLVPLAIVVAVALVDWLAALLLLLAAPLIPAFMALVGMGAEAVSRTQHQALARLGGYFLDRLQGLDLLRHLGRADDEARTLESVGEAYRRRSMAVLRVAFLSSAVLEFFSSVAIALVAVYIGMGLLGYLALGPAPELTLFSGLFVLLLAPEFFQPLRQLAQHYHDRAAALGAAAELRRLEETPSPMPPGGDEQPPGAAPAIELSGVTVAGDTGAPILADLALSIPAGQAVLVTGASGSGKTTLLHVVAAFREPDRGEVRIDGTSLGTLDRAAWQQRLGWLAQVPHLFPASVRSNLDPGDHGVDTGTLEHALERAGARAFTARLAQGLDTPLDERGGGLSGGEGQRLALARALVRRAPVLLVDEPTASLDPETADHVSETLRAEAARGATVIIASHAAEQFPWVNRVITLTGGRITGDRHA